MVWYFQIKTTYKGVNMKTFWEIYRKNKGIDIRKLIDTHNVQLRAGAFELDTEAYLYSKYIEEVHVNGTDILFPPHWDEHQYFHAFVTTACKEKINREKRKKQNKYWKYLFYIDRCAIALMCSLHGVDIINKKNYATFFEAGFPEVTEGKVKPERHTTIAFLESHMQRDKKIVQSVIENIKTCIYLNQLT
jgi:hypothetical protein